MQSGRPTVSMDGKIGPAKLAQQLQASPKVKPIVVTNRVHSSRVRTSFKISPITQAVGAVGLLLMIGVVVTLFNNNDGTAKTITTTTSIGAPDVISVPAVAPIKSVVSEVDILASVVQVVSKCRDGSTHSGSGTVFIEELYILTSNHVVSSDGDCLVVELFVETIERIDSAPLRTHTAKIFAIDEHADLAILKIAPIDTFAKVLKPVKVSSKSNIGDPIIAIGFPGIGGDSVTVTSGEISGYANYDGIQWIKSSVSISGGNSGGGVFDSSGGLVGIPTRVGTAGVERATDCRPDRDTNNDGTIDNDDQCVPVGGFINSLSPVGRAVDLAIANGLRLAP